MGFMLLVLAGSLSAGCHKSEDDAGNELELCDEHGVQYSLSDDGGRCGNGSAQDRLCGGCDQARRNRRRRLRGQQGRERPN